MTQRKRPDPGTTQWTLDREETSAAMPAPHGSSPAAWTTVVLTLVAFLVGAAGLIMDNWVIFWSACGLLVVAVLAGKVLQLMGLGTR